MVVVYRGVHVHLVIYIVCNVMYEEDTKRKTYAKWIYIGDSFVVIN